MNIALFYHSLLSDWNHGNAHFLRGVAWELRRRGHAVAIFEAERGWSLSHLIAEHGERPLREFRRRYPGLDSYRYDLESFDLYRALAGRDLVIVHEWNDPGLVRAIGEHRKSRGGYRLFFHDTHHRSVTDPEAIAAYDLSGYDGVLAFGRAIADVYASRGWARRAWVWHEGADARVFRPLAGAEKIGDLVWIGNWGDDERAAELQEFLLEPVKTLKLKARVFGVRYPGQTLAALSEAGIDYAGWLPNYRVPEVFAQFRVTVHVHRRPYVEKIPGIPTIRPFEALACGIPLVCSRWDDREGLFNTGEDYLLAADGAQMKRHLETILTRPEVASRLSHRGRRTVLERHTCAHRVDELLAICAEVDRAQMGRNAAAGCKPASRQP